MRKLQNLLSACALKWTIASLAVWCNKYGMGDIFHVYLYVIPFSLCKWGMNVWICGIASVHEKVGTGQTRQLWTSCALAKVDWLLEHRQAILTKSFNWMCNVSTWWKFHIRSNMQMFMHCAELINYYHLTLHVYLQSDTLFWWMTNYSVPNAIIIKLSINQSHKSPQYVEK